MKPLYTGQCLDTNTNFQFGEVWFIEGNFTKDVQFGKNSGVLRV